jgi:predicted Zn-dependent peptidase
MSDVALHPTFPEKELQRVRDELLTSLIQAQDDPEQLVRFAFPRLVFGTQHRYGTLSVGTAAAIKGFAPDDLKQFHAKHYVPGNSLLIVAGDVTPDAVVPLLEKSFGNWKGTAPAPASPMAATQLKARQLYLIDKPGSAQSQIRVGWVGVPRSTPDYFALRVLNTILGEAFTSRLNTNLREEHGYAYGASSAFDMRAAAGPFYAAPVSRPTKRPSRCRSSSRSSTQFESRCRPTSSRRRRTISRCRSPATSRRPPASPLRSRSCSFTVCRTTTTGPSPVASRR